jgi:hypothetical protein
VTKDRVNSDWNREVTTVLLLRDGPSPDRVVVTRGRGFR